MSPNFNKNYGNFTVFVVKYTSCGTIYCVIETNSRKGKGMNSTRVELDRKWQHILWKCMLITYICVLVIEMGSRIFWKGTVEKGLLGCIVGDIIVTAVVSVLILVITGYRLKKKPDEVSRNTWGLCIMYVVMFGCVALVHYGVPFIALLPFGAVIGTTVFADNTLTGVSSLLALVFSCISQLLLYNLAEWKIKQFGENVMLSLVVAVGVYVMTSMCNRHTNELIQAINDIHVKQLNLLSELKKEPLTGLYNRKTFDESIQAQVRNCNDVGAVAVLAMFDIDHFKNVNDTYGHSNGDTVIKVLCSIIKKKISDYGLGFRYGGEEFAVLFTGIDEEKVLSIVEDIRTEFRCYYFQFMRKDGLTVSCGIARYRNNEKGEDWFNRTDEALYKAKETGRNKTVISDR